MMKEHVEGTGMSEEVMKLVFLFRVADKEMAYKIREELYTFIQENSELKKRYCGTSIQKL